MPPSFEYGGSPPFHALAMSASYVKVKDTMEYASTTNMAARETCFRRPAFSTKLITTIFMSGVKKIVPRLAQYLGC